VAASFAGRGTYVQGGSEPRLAVATPRRTALPGFELPLEAPTFTVLPPSDAELEFVAAQATKAPCVAKSTATAIPIQIFARRDTRKALRSSIEQGRSSTGEMGAVRS
jgi:hypothetical protein